MGSALLVLDYRAMREPRDVERVTGTIPRFFIFSSNHFAWESAKTKQNKYETNFVNNGFGIAICNDIRTDSTNI